MATVHLSTSGLSGGRTRSKRMRRTARLTWAAQGPLVFVLALLVGAPGCGRGAPATAPTLLTPGALAPSLQAEGWLNGDVSNVAKLQGQLIVVHAWAYWCAPCVAKFPELLRLQHHYQPQGVVFLGLTAEGVQGLDETRLQLVRSQVHWLNGWGAADTLARLGVSEIPAELLIGRDGRILWTSAQSGSLATALDQALSAGEPHGPPPPAISANLF